MEESKENEYNYLFDDRELEELSDEEIVIDEEFEKELRKEMDDYLKEHPIEYEEGTQDK